MAILSDFLHAMNREEPAVGSGSSSIGTTVFVMNTNAMAVTAGWDDPYYHINNASGYDSIKPIVVPAMGLHLELNVAFRGTISNADTPVVAIYGEVPAAQPGNSYWPKDVSSTLVGSSDNGETGSEVTNQFWVPLVDQDNIEVQISDHQEVDHHNLIALFPDAVTALDSGDASPGIKLGVPRRVYLSGCTRVICTIETACAGASEAMIIGRFVG
jgi:hypothetical protein